MLIYVYIYIYIYICLWFRPSLIYINNRPTRCKTKQSIYYSASSLYMFRVSNTPIITSIQNCNYSLRYWSYFLCSYLPPTRLSLATLEGPLLIYIYIYIYIYLFELGYKDLGFFDTSSITLITQWYQLISHKACVFLTCLVRHT